MSQLPTAHSFNSKGRKSMNVILSPAGVMEYSCLDFIPIKYKVYRRKDTIASSYESKLETSQFEIGNKRLTLHALK
jgi:hypothetical protein